MLSFLALLFSIYLGYLLITSTPFADQKTEPINIFLATGFGLGVSSHLVLYNILLFDQLNPLAIILSHLKILLLFIVLRNRFGHHLPKNPSPIRNNDLPIFFLISTPFLILLIINALSSPYGDWDAWGFWNVRANFIFRAGPFWNDVLPTEINHHPWLLPLTIVWGWSFAGREDNLIPLLIPIIYTVSTVGLLVFGLSDYIEKKFALLAGIFLLSIPFFMYHSTSQYAEIEVCYYLLGACICLFRTLKYESIKYSFFCGAFLGLLSFTKIEGILEMILLTFLIYIYFLINQKKSFLFLILFLGMAIFSLPTIIVKCFVSPNLNHGLGLNWSLIGDFQRTALIITSFLQHVFWVDAWGGLWIIGTIMLFMKRHSLVQKEIIIITIFIFLFMFALFLRFQITPLYLEWHLSTVLYRALFQITPLLIFLIFYSVFEDRNLSTNRKNPQPHETN